MTVPKPVRLVPAAPQAFAGLRVLLIDEDASVRAMFRSCLGTRGATVTAIGGDLPAELRSLLSVGKQYDLVFMALPHPAINNEDMAIVLKSHPAFENVLKVALFQRDDVQARLLMHRPGITLHLVNPTPKHIVSLVAQHSFNRDAWLR